MVWYQRNSLCSMKCRTIFWFFFAPENMKQNALKSFSYSAPQCFFSQPTQNQPKSYVLFHKKWFSPQLLYTGIPRFMLLMWGPELPSWQPAVITQRTLREFFSTNPAWIANWLQLLVPDKSHKRLKQNESTKIVFIWICQINETNCISV